MKVVLKKHYTFKWKLQLNMSRKVIEKQRKATSSIVLVASYLVYELINDVYNTVMKKLHILHKHQFRK